MPPVRRTRPSRALAAATALLAAATLTACSSAEVGSSGEQGFVAGNGIITTLPAAERKAPGEVAGVFGNLPVARLVFVPLGLADDDRALPVLVVDAGVVVPGSAVMGVERPAG